MGLAYHRKKHDDKSRFYCCKCDHFIHSNIYEEHVSISNCAKNDAFICEEIRKKLSYLHNHQEDPSSVQGVLQHVPHEHGEASKYHRCGKISQMWKNISL